ncbi:MAG: hypothetical protein RQ966_17725 [Acetobacteraceae bacterium]|nr:hypothetical protein [Acetobacteraceae bacterium]
MSSDRFNDIMNRGLGNAARATGHDYDVFRPRTPLDPLASENLIMRLPMSLGSVSSGLRLPRGFERAITATFDALASQVGDYLRGPRGVLFIAVLPPLRRAVCILTNASVDVLRASGSVAAGLNAYGGVTETSLSIVLRDWPVQIVSAGSGRSGTLPADGGQTNWSVVMPRTPVPVLPSDILQDSAGRRYLVRTAEMTEAGCWLSVRGTEA